MPNHQSLLKAARKVLDMKPQLYPLLFDEAGVMFEQQRQKFLSFADLIIKQSFKALQNYKITDIILVGSTASYFYSEDSDFDIKILLDLSDNKAVGANFKNFLKILNNTFYCSSIRFRLDGRFVDMKFDVDQNFIMGNYSIMHNRWNIVPRNNFDIRKIKVEALLKMFYEATAYMYEKFSTLPFKNGFLVAEDAKSLQNVYDYFLLADNHLRENMDKGLREFLCFKLIRKFRYLHEIDNIERQTVVDRLSLREEKNK